MYTCNTYLYFYEIICVDLMKVCAIITYIRPIFRFMKSLKSTLFAVIILVFKYVNNYFYAFLFLLNAHDLQKQIYNHNLHSSNNYVKDIRHLNYNRQLNYIPMRQYYLKP